ncbi:MAG: thioredoxin family protein [Vicinamibacterales bacterium]|jgi:cytochrome c biogenesis protein CcdA|nr:thioredoxin family protein [Vicinamibacterales bacterium]
MRKLALVLCIVGVAAAVTVSAQIKRPQATVTPLVERQAAAAGSAVRLALKVSLPENLHTQSNKPLDPTLIPTVLTIDAPAGVTVDEIVYPAAIALKQEGLEQPLAVFEHEFLVGAQVTLSSNVPGGELTLPGRLRYQACNDMMCFAPVTTEFAWSLRVVPAGSRVDGAADPAFASIAFGRGEQPVSRPDAQPGPAPGAATPAAAGNMDVVKALDGFTVLGTTGGYLGVDEFLTFIRNAETGVKERGMFEGRGPLAILLIVLLGGLALNLTPCVLPMIPINIAIIGAGAQAGSRARGFLLGSAYGAAMALVYGLIGLVVILTAGTFGTINSSPWFNLGIAVLFVVLALAMFDVLVIDFSRLGSSFKPGASRGSIALAFTMGAVAALLAGACVAPVVIQVVLFSSNMYAAGTTLALALPFCLGLGMALPWPFIGAGLAALPKPGMWMVRVKQAFGVFILATAIYYGYQAYTLFANRWVDPSAVQASVEAQLKSGWHNSLAQGIAAARAEQKPLLIDFWATWCKNCLTMDTTTFEDEKVKAALSGFVKVKFQAEDLDAQPAKALMQKFDAVGLPTYVILRPNP